MKSLLLISNLILFSFLHAQTTKLDYRNIRGWNLVYENNMAISMDRQFELMRPYPESFKYIESARDCKFYSKLTSFAAGGLIGWPLGKFLISGDFDWPYFAAGVGMCGISFSLKHRFKKQTKRAIDSYNSSVSTSTLSPLNRFDLKFSANNCSLIFQLGS